MEEAEEVWERRADRISMQISSSSSRDLLQSFISMNEFSEKLEEPNEDREELELSLGLSMNGQLGVDPKAKKLVRSCSIPDFVNPAREEEDTVAQVRRSYTTLMRTRSLPTETEEEWRKRKELQTLRRTEAKRKRLEKQRNWKAAREKRKSVEGFNGTNQIEQCAKALSEFAKLTTSSSGIPNIAPPLPPPSQAAIGSHGTGSCGISLFKNQTAQDSKKKPPFESGAFTTESSEKIVAAAKEDKDLLKSAGEDMPSVSTKGLEPNGKRIEGFLYRYKEREEVMIVCVCHGTFLTPAEFVKHAGGGDVAHPLKHIVVNRTIF